MISAITAAQPATRISIYYIYAGQCIAVVHDSKYVEQTCVDHELTLPPAVGQVRTCLFDVRCRAFCGIKQHKHLLKVGHHSALYDIHMKHRYWKAAEF